MKKIMKIMKLRHNFYVKYPELGATHLHLLERIGIHETDGKPLSVTAAMKLADVASPATVHRMLDDLEASGLVKKSFRGNNVRTKHLTLTMKSSKYFFKLDLHVIPK